MDSNNLPNKRDAMATNSATGLPNLDLILQAGGDNAQGSDVIDQLQAMQRLFEQQSQNQATDDQNKSEGHAAGNLNAANPDLGGLSGAQLAQSDQMPSIQGQLSGGAQGDLMPNLGLGAGLPGQVPGLDPLTQQMLMMYQNPLMPNMNTMPGLNLVGMQGLGIPNVMSSAAQFHQPAEKNQIKLFIGALAFNTTEQNLMSYFQEFGKVENTIVMRDKMTGRGRGFGFVLLTFKDEQEAQQQKSAILQQNKDGGHFILDKRVDVKSADDYQKGALGAQDSLQPNQRNQSITTASGQQIQKPNPYVICEQKDNPGAETNDNPESKEKIEFKYPNSKIFVGGLDFKLTNQELKEHFSQFGEVNDAIILKDIFTGQSRGFGFVQFKEEEVASNLVRNHPFTEINGRRVDIKKAVVKQGGNGLPMNPKASYAQQPPPTGGAQNDQEYGRDYNKPAVIPPYGSSQRQEQPIHRSRERDERDRYYKSGRDQRQRSRSHSYSPPRHEGGHRSRYNNRERYEDRDHHRGYQRDFRRDERGPQQSERSRYHRRGSDSSRESGQESYHGHQPHSSSYRNRDDKYNDSRQRHHYSNRDNRDRRGDRGDYY